MWGVVTRRPGTQREGGPDPTAVFSVADLALHLDRLRREAGRERGRRRLGLDTLARRTGVPRSTLHTYLAGRSLPPPEVLDRLVLELGATGAQAREWARAWERVADASRGNRSRTTLSARSKFLSLDTEVNRQLGSSEGEFGGLQDVAVQERIQLGDDRRIDWHEMRMTVRAVRDGVDRFSLRLHGEPWMDLDRIGVSQLVNCRTGEHRTLGDPRVRVFELVFDHPLSAGETQVFDFRIDYVDARVEPDTSAATAVETEAIRGFRQAGPLLVIEVRFPPGDAPVRLRQVHLPSVDADAPETVVGPLQLDERHAAHIVVQEATAGFHGIRWDWTDRAGDGRPGAPAR